jgi:hypothetical protein
VQKAASKMLANGCLVCLTNFQRFVCMGVSLEHQPIIVNGTKDPLPKSLKAASRLQGSFHQVETLIQPIAADPDVGWIFPDRLDPVIGLDQIIPYPTGRFFRGTLSQALRARLRSGLSLRDTVADMSQQH